VLKKELGERVCYLMSFDADASPAEVVDVLRRDGGVIVRNLAPVELIDAAPPSCDRRSMNSTTVNARALVVQDP